MQYPREIPRDLFNEANLLKCYGQLWLNLEKVPQTQAEMIYINIDNGFDVIQDQSDGSLCLANVALVVRGEHVPLMRPLNSRNPYPLYVVLPDDDLLPVFEDDGKFTEEMKQFIWK